MNDRATIADPARPLDKMREIEAELARTLRNRRRQIRRANTGNLPKILAQAEADVAMRRIDLLARALRIIRTIRVTIE